MRARVAEQRTGKIDTMAPGRGQESRSGEVGALLGAAREPECGQGVEARGAIVETRLADGSEDEHLAGERFVTEERAGRAVGDGEAGLRRDEHGIAGLEPRQRLGALTGEKGANVDQDLGLFAPKDGDVTDIGAVEEPPCLLDCGPHVGGAGNYEQAGRGDLTGHVDQYAALLDGQAHPGGTPQELGELASDRGSGGRRAHAGDRDPSVDAERDLAVLVDDDGARLVAGAVGDDEGQRVARLQHLVLRAGGVGEGDYDGERGHERARATDPGDRSWVHALSLLVRGSPARSPASPRGRPMPIGLGVCGHPSARASDRPKVAASICQNIRAHRHYVVRLFGPLCDPCPGSGSPSAARDSPGKPVSARLHGEGDGGENRVNSAV